MEAEDFTVNKNEWWHFDYKDWQDYAIYDIPFSVIGGEKTSKPKIEERKDFKRFFDQANVSGGIYIYDLRRNKYLIYDRERFDRQFVPASTSKIIHSLVFLDSGALGNENETIKWDGVKRSVEAWNQDHNLRSAIKVSAVWFYVEASKRVGQVKMQKYYDAANYGNRNTGGFGVDYWNKGDLRITPREQIDFLVRFYENRLPFAPSALATVKDILIQEKTDKYVLRGKTGWSNDYTPQVGWYVGYVERGADAYFFATEIDIKKAADLAKRAEITKNVLRSLRIIE
jgi:beta-lactamase class D